MYKDYVTNNYNYDLHFSENSKKEFFESEPNKTLISSAHRYIYEVSKIATWIGYMTTSIKNAGLVVILNNY